jgi:hypothetical protein
MAHGTVVVTLAVVLGAAPFAACAPESGTATRDGGRDDADGRADALGDADGRADADYVPEAREAGDADTSVRSFIWIANTGEGTLSKVHTVTAVEVARYITGPYGTANDPSRTSVNRHGDMVVTNRNPNLTARPSVTKFAANESDCVDRNAKEPRNNYWSVQRSHWRGRMV